MQLMKPIKIKFFLPTLDKAKPISGDVNSTPPSNILHANDYIVMKVIKMQRLIKKDFNILREDYSDLSVRN